MNAVETAIYARLAGRVELTLLLASASGIYNLVAPQRAAYPLVIFGLNAGGDENKSPHRSKSLRYLVKAVSQTSLKNAGSIDAELDTALHGVLLTVTGWTNTWLMRESGDVRYEEIGADGKRYFHAGGIYRVRLAK